MKINWSFGEKNMFATIKLRTSQCHVSMLRYQTLKMFHQTLNSALKIGLSEGFKLHNPWGDGDTVTKEKTEDHECNRSTSPGIDPNAHSIVASRKDGPKIHPSTFGSGLQSLMVPLPGIPSGPGVWLKPQTPGPDLHVNARFSSTGVRFDLSSLGRQLCLPIQGTMCFSNKWC